MQSCDDDELRQLHDDALTIFQTGVNAADPYLAVKKSLKINEGQLELILDGLDPGKKRLGRWSKIHLIAIGKAAGKMAAAARDVIPEELIACPGIVVTTFENKQSLSGFQVFGAGHPMPDEAGQEAALRVAERVREAQQNELLLVLLSGGGSALLPLPAEGISLQEKRETTRLLLASGAIIEQVNCVRKHLSRLKGGRLAKLAYPADLHTVMLSDVISDDLSSIASGPTVADDSTFADAVTVLQQKKIWFKVPEAVRLFLQRGCQGAVCDTPGSGDPVFDSVSYALAGSNRISVNAMLHNARQMAYETILYSDRLIGNARDEAEKLVFFGKAILEQGWPEHSALAILAGGETTVTVSGKGQGGRNQEMALAFAVAAEKQGLPGCWVFLSGGTDGRDGPTPAAGGIVDPQSLTRLNDCYQSPADKLNPSLGHALELLENNDSYHGLKLSGDLLLSGATGTNVADLQILLIRHMPSINPAR